MNCSTTQVIFLFYVYHFVGIINFIFIGFACMNFESGSFCLEVVRDDDADIESTFQKNCKVFHRDLCYATTDR